jgi:hypothetical protein
VTCYLSIGLLWEPAELSWKSRINPDHEILLSLPRCIAPFLTLNGWPSVSVGSLAAARGRSFAIAALIAEYRLFLRYDDAFDQGYDLDLSDYFPVIWAEVTTFFLCFKLCHFAIGSASKLSRWVSENIFFVWQGETIDHLYSFPVFLAVVGAFSHAYHFDPSGTYKPD